ncbi:GNAT family N-acetyltransferase [Oscillospiraceae bacterium MB08-C2-2]|nr:GNAT family N-acetyltransferase [Oscillospiraceae bacterium MB08-C2-2]
MKVSLKSIQTKQDVAELLPLLQKIWREVFPPIIGAEQTEYMLCHYQSPDNIMHEITDGAQYFLIEADGERVGYTAYEIRADHLFISKIYLLNSQRGKGLSSGLFDWLENEARKAGKNRLHLHVNRKNQQAIAVYQHKGFAVVDSVDHDIGNGYVMDDFYMEKPLIQPAQ